LHVEEERMEVRREVVLDAPVEEVWDALTDPDRLEEWFAEPDVLVEEVEERRRVAYELEESRVAIELEEVDGGTRVLVTETGEPAWNAVFALRSLAYAYA
jgi:uncharacterized protein YndB with AHSA1/START domain